MAHDDPAPPLNTHPRFRLGDALIDPPRLRVERGGVSRRVEAKVMQTLLALVRKPGQVVSRRDLEREVWPGRVVTEDAVTSTIGKLRRALQDNPRAPRVIETIAKSGYRLKLSPEPEPAGPVAAGGQRGPRRRRALGAGIGVIALVIIALAAWRSWQPAPVPGEVAETALSIAVVPLDVLGDERSQSYFAEGLTLDLITALSHFPQLLVIAPGSVFGYRDAAADDRAIGAELGVRYLIRGGVQRGDGHMRINVRLLEAASGRTLWADRFAGEPSDVFRIQDQVVRGIVAALPRQLALPERPVTRSGATDSIAAYDELLRGMAHYGRRTPDDNVVARGHFERAIALDPGFARAYAGLALVWSRLAIDGWTEDAARALSKAEALADRAAAIDPSVPQIHFVRGQVALFEGRHDQAAAAATRAIELDPNYADAFALLAWVLNYAGRPDRAEPALAEARRRNPDSAASYDQIAGEIRFATGRLEAAEAFFRAALARNPAHMRARLWLAATLVQLGREDEAAWEVQELLTINPDFSLSRLLFAFPLKDPRQHERLTSALARLGLPE
jgi:TolB-like protein/DNA-binding winged helix-turn-helix (wHTH) protein/Tfp pilus assembly protein PilF